MNKQIHIGLMGCSTNNGNMGCLALTYSLVYLLERIAEEESLNFVYYLFEGAANSGSIMKLCKEMDISEEKFLKAQSGAYRKLRSQIKHYIQNRKMKKSLSSCDLVIDLTQGDSFTDIYGQDRFNNGTRIKHIVEKNGIPMILGPQTYGPFNDENNRKFAIQVIEEAALVISRDKKSADYINNFSNKNVEVVTDLAFFLPYKEDKKKSDKVRVGVNISGLLIKNKTEGTILTTGLSVDYDLFISKLLEYLTNDSKYEVHLIPHVGVDGNLEYRDKYKGVIVHDPFVSPTQAKSSISGMDIFIGARMHATIAAISSGVATIPVAYSRKFAGLYEGLGYNHTIDLCSLSTDDAFKQTIDMIKNYKSLKEEVESLKVTVEFKKEQLKALLKEGIIRVVR